MHTRHTRGIERQSPSAVQTLKVHPDFVSHGMMGFCTLGLHRLTGELVVCSGAEQLSLLRVAEIVVWMTHRPAGATEAEG